jgi:hypothetical protein
MYLLPHILKFKITVHVTISTSCTCSHLRYKEKAFENKRMASEVRHRRLIKRYPVSILIWRSHIVTWVFVFFTSAPEQTPVLYVKESHDSFLPSPCELTTIPNTFANLHKFLKQRTISVMGYASLYYLRKARIYITYNNKNIFISEVLRNV